MAAILFFPVHEHKEFWFLSLIGNKVNSVRQFRKDKSVVQVKEVSAYTKGDVAATYPWEWCTHSIFKCVQMLWLCPYYMSQLQVPSVCITQVFCRCKMSLDMALQHDPSYLATFKELSHGLSTLKS